MAYVDTVGDIIRSTQAFIFTNGQVEEVNLHWICVNTGGTDTRTSVANTLDTWWGLDLQTFTASPQKLYGTQVHLVKTTTFYSPVNTIINSFGTGSAITLPTAVRPIVQWRTGQQGPGYRGRAYLNTPGEGSTAADGSPSAVFRTAMQTWANRVVAGIFIAGSLWNPVVFHRVPKLPLLLTNTPITGGGPTNKYGTQHRSGAYGKANVAPW